MSVPDRFTPTLKPNAPVKVIKATDSKGNIITNKLKLFMNLRWDKEMCDDQGGVDLDNFAKYIGSSVLWVAYLLEYELGNEYETFINSTKDNDYSSDSLRLLLRSIIIDVGNKLVYKLHDDDDVHPRNILFGEVNFH
jgi:hypothetical protein